MQVSVQLLSIWRCPQWAMASFTRNYPLYKPLHYLKQTTWIIIKWEKLPIFQYRQWHGPLWSPHLPLLMWILSIWLVFKFRLIKRFWVNRIWQVRSFLRRVLGDTWGLGTGETEWLCYFCSSRGLDASVNQSSGKPDKMGASENRPHLLCLEPRHDFPCGRCSSVCSLWRRTCVKQL